MCTRRARQWGAVALLSALLAGTAAAAPASALIAPTDDESASVADERAIIRWDGTTEQIDLLLDLDATAGSAGLIFPTPTPAKVTAGDPALFAEVERYASPRPILVDDWWGFGVPGEEPDEAEPAVLDRVRLGDVEATTLRASNVAGMTAWLRKNDYGLPQGGRDALKAYVKKGWSFVAVKLVGKNAEDSPTALNGELDPIHISFRTDELVYPVRLGVTSEAPKSLRLYVFSDTRVVLRQFDNSNRPVNAAQTTAWAGTVKNPGIIELGKYLTAFDLRFDQPAKQLVSDIVAVPAIANDEVLPTEIVANPLTLLGIPTGLLIVGWGGFGFILGAAFIISRLRSR